MYHSKLDENTGQLHSITYNKGKIISSSRSDSVKLRDTNLNYEQHQRCLINSRKPPALDGYIREPEKALSSARVWQKHRSKCIKVEPLEDIEAQYIPESPSLEYTLTVSSPVVHETFKPNVDMSDFKNCSKFNEQSFDCAPFYHVYDYENRISSKDYGTIVGQLMRDQTEGKKPIFQRELEYQELKCTIGKVDYILHHFFGIDKNGFFELKKDRDAFHESILNAYTCPLVHPKKDDK